MNNRKPPREFYIYEWDHRATPEFWAVTDTNPELNPFHKTDDKVFIKVREVLPDEITPTKPTGSVSMDDIIDAEATKCALLYIGDESAHITKDCNLDILEHHFTQGSHFGYRMRDTEVKSLQTKLDVAMGVLSKFHDHNDPSMQYVNCIACIALSTINEEIVDDSRT